MSEIVSAGENELLVFFQEYLNRRATGKEPPITIKAKDLDKNYKLATVINNPDESEEDRSYTVEYREEGTVLKDIKGLPPNAIAKEIDICENGQPASYWFVVWEEEPDLGQ
jgi:hypothetical protein